MNKAYNTKSTKSMRAVDSDLTIDECSEPGCKMTLLVEKSEIAQGRKTRCTACIMKAKINGKMLR